MAKYSDGNFNICIIYKNKYCSEMSFMRTSSASYIPEVEAKRFILFSNDNKMSEMNAHGNGLGETAIKH
ncbi:hypothetical protein [Paenibacillus sp. FSL R7-0272]|uniref:hypothetical protein n=1 Tax=Paenibacillus sp. FSL R7-0272 TaxID=2921679 RepID=UPI0030DD88C6